MNTTYHMLKNIPYVIFSIFLLSIILFFSIYFELIDPSVDSEVFINLTNIYIENSINFSNILFDKNFHVIFLYLLQVYNLNFNLYYIFNIFFLSWSLFLVFNIIDLMISKNKINQILITKLLVIFFTCFLPSIYFFYTQYGKEIIIIFSFIYLVKFLFFDDFSKFNLLNIFNFLILFSTILFLLSGKDYLIISFILFIFFYFCLNRNHILLKKILFIVLLISIITLLKYFFIDSIQLNFFTYATIVSNEFNPISIEFSHDLKNIFDRFALPFNKIRYTLINHSIKSEATSLISSVTPSNFIESLKLFIYTFYQSVIFPSSYFGNDISILYRIASFENFIYLFCISSILFNNKDNYQIYLLIYSFLISAILLYLNPNIGSFYKQKASLMYLLSIFGIINWIKIFDQINYNLFNSINNKAYNNEISKISSDSFKISILIIVVSLLVIYRDYLVLIYLTDLNLLDYYFILLVSFGILSSSINIPLNESINLSLLKKEYFNMNSITNLLAISYFLTLFLFVFYFNNQVFNKIYIFTLISIFYISIFVNSIFTNYFIINNKNILIYYGQIFGTLLSIFYIYINLNILNDLIIFTALIIWMLSTILVNFIFSSNIKYFYQTNFKFSKYISNNDLLKKFFSNIFMNLSLILLVLIFFIDKNYYRINYSLRFYLYFFTFFIIIFNFIINPFLNKSYKDKKNQEVIFVFLNFIFPLSIIFVLFIIISIEWILLYVLNKSAIYSIELVESIKLIFLGVPVHLANYFFTKFLVIDEKYKKIFIIYFISNLIFCILIYQSYYYELNILICFLGTSFFQFILLNFSNKNRYEMIVEKSNLLLISILYLFYFLNLKNFITDQSILYLLFLILLFIKYRFYDNKKNNIYSY